MIFAITGYLLIPWLTFWRNDILFDVMTYLLISWRISHTFWHYTLFDVMTQFLTLRHAFWRHSIFFWYHDILSILFDIFLTSLRTFHICRLCHDILKDKAQIRQIILYFLPCLRSKCVSEEGIARLGILWMLVNQSSMAKLTTLTNDKCY